MAHVFISYSRKDIESARKLTEAFKGQDLDFWIDWEEIPPTVEWWREIEKGIEGADNFLFLLSPDSASSRVCKRELEHAVKNGKRLIPVLVRDIRAEEAPEELRPLNWIFLKEESEFQAAFRALVSAIRTDYEWVQTHRRLQIKALEWERGGHEDSLLLRGKDMESAESQLALNSFKEPHPTDFQRAYVLRSRQASDRQRRWLVSISIGVAILMAGLAVYGFVQARLATDRANIALARQLAAQSQSLNLNSRTTAIQSGLLAVEAGRRSIDLAAYQALSRYLRSAALPLASMNHDATAISFSQDGKYIVSGSDDGTAYVWDAATGKEVAHIAHDGSIHSVAFSLDGRHVVSGSDDGTARIWESTTGREIAHITYDWSVNSVAFSPDGRYVVSGSDDGTARIWESTTGKEIFRLTQAGPVYSVSFSPDGKWVASAGCGKPDAIWVCLQGIILVQEATTGEEVSHMTQDNLGWVNSIAFSPDSKYVVSGSGDGDYSARVWDVLTGKEVSRIIHSKWVNSVAFSPDGRYVVSGSEDGTARVWEPNSGVEITRVTHDGPVNSVVFSPDGRYVVSGSDDGTALIWEAVTGNAVTRITTNGSVSSVAFSPDGRKVAAGVCNQVDSAGSCIQGSVFLWEQSRGEEVAHITQNGPVHSVAFSPDGRWVVSGGCDKINPQNNRCPEGTARVWEASTGRELGHETHDSWINSIVFSANGKYVVSASDDGTARVWEAATGKEVARVVNNSSVNSVALSPDGRWVVSGGCAKEDPNDGDCLQGIVRVWKITGEEVAQINQHGPVHSVAFSPDSKWIASGGCDNVDSFWGDCLVSLAHIWDAASGKEIARLAHEGPVYAVEFSPNSKWAASGGCDTIDSQSGDCLRGTAFVWESTTGKVVARMIHDGSVNTIVFSLDSKYVVSGSGDGTARVWDLAIDKEIASLTHDGGVKSVAFSPDGKHLVSGSGDNTARVWETTTGKEIARMIHDNSVNSVAFSPDGRYILSGSEDGTTRVWYWQIEDLMHAACQRLSRNLTRAEWVHYVGNESFRATCTNLPLEPEAAIKIAPESNVLILDNIDDYYRLILLWMVVIYISGGWIGYRTILSRSRSNTVSNNMPLTWEYFVMAISQGGLLVILILAGFFIATGLIWDHFASEEFLPSPFLLLYLLPSGFWVGGVYGHLTRFHSAKLSRTRRTLLGSTAGFVGAFLGSLILTVPILLSAGLASTVGWLAIILFAFVDGIINGILSALGVLIYIFGIQNWIDKSMKPNQVLVDQ